MALMLPPAVLQGEARLEVSLLRSPQWGLHRDHPLQPRYRWVQKKLELGFVLELQLVEFLPLVAFRLRELLGFEPALALGPPLLRQLLVELQKQLVLVLVLMLMK
jgi:hypothetical protein